MKAAGINPMAAFMKGGASTPTGGGSPQGSDPKLGQGITSGISAGIGIQKLKAELDLIEETSWNQQESGNLAHEKEKTELLMQQIAAHHATSAGAKAQIDKIDARIYDNKWGKMLRGAEKIAPVVGTAVGAAAAYKFGKGLRGAYKSTPRTLPKRSTGKGTRK